MSINKSAKYTLESSSFLCNKTFFRDHIDDFDDDNDGVIDIEDDDDDGDGIKDREVRIEIKF